MVRTYATPSPPRMRGLVEKRAELILRPEAVSSSDSCRLATNRGCASRMDVCRAQMVSPDHRGLLRYRFIHGHVAYTPDTGNPLQAWPNHCAVALRRIRACRKTETASFTSIQCPTRSSNSPRRHAQVIPNDAALQGPVPWRPDPSEILPLPRGHCARMPCHRRSRMRHETVIHNRDTLSWSVFPLPAMALSLLWRRTHRRQNLSRSCSIAKDGVVGHSPAGLPTDFTISSRQQAKPLFPREGPALRHVSLIRATNQVCRPETRGPISPGNCSPSPPAVHGSQNLDLNEGVNTIDPDAAPATWAEDMTFQFKSAPSSPLVHADGRA